jgi:hypothetical protein
VGHFTIDNASNNKTCMQELEIFLHAREVEFEALDRQVMCFPHVMHICVTHVIEDFTDTDLITISEAWTDAFPDNEARKAYAEAVGLDPIEMGCNIVQAIRVSGLCRDNFMDTVKTGNIKGWFKSPAGEAQQVPELELLRDVRTRWDSTYMMINHLCALHPVCTVCRLDFVFR